MLHKCLCLVVMVCVSHISCTPPRVIEFPNDAASSFVQQPDVSIESSQDVQPDNVDALTTDSASVSAQSSNSFSSLQQSTSGFRLTPDLSGISGLSPASLAALKALPSFQNLPTSASNLPNAGASGLAGIDSLPNFPTSKLPTSVSNFGAFSQASSLTQGAGSGLLKILSTLGGQLGRSFGLNQLLGQNGLNPSQLAGLAGNPADPSVAAVANSIPVGFPGVPSFPAGGLGLISGSVPSIPGRKFDIMGLIGALSRRALSNTNATELLQPERLQQFSDNITDTLTPDLPKVDLSKCMGRWFEGVNSPKASDQRCIVHHYGGLTENGDTATFTALKIYRQGSEFGQVQYSIGYAFRGGRQPGMLEMHTSESQDPIPYWIYLLGPEGKDEFGNAQYEYAVVSNWIRYPLTVLVRDPDRFQKKYYEDVLRWLENKGFINDFTRAFNLVQPVDYSNCQYEDSTFAALG